MSNKQWSKCRVCGLDERFIGHDSDNAEMRTCKNKCSTGDFEWYMNGGVEKPFPIRSDQNWKSDNK